MISFCFIDVPVYLELGLHKMILGYKDMLSESKPAQPPHCVIAPKSKGSMIV